MTGYKFLPNDLAQISLNAAASGIGLAIPFNDCRQINWVIEGVGVIGGGVVVIECAHSQGYAGLWKELDRIDATALNGGALEGNTFPMPPGGFVRGRVETPITGGGTVTVRLNGLQG